MAMRLAASLWRLGASWGGIFLNLHPFGGPWGAPDLEYTSCFTRYNEGPDFERVTPNRPEVDRSGLFGRSGVDLVGRRGLFERCRVDLVGDT